MKLTVRHRTRYTYSDQVSFGDHHLFLRPRDSHVLVVDAFAVRTDPAGRQRWMRDVFNNIVLVTNFGLNSARSLDFDCTLTVRSLEANPFDFVLEPYATGFPFRYEQRERVALGPSIETPIPGSRTVLDWFYTAVPSPNSHADIVQFLSDLNSAVRTSIAYVRRDEEGVQAPDETLRMRRGSCRDMALLFMAVCRQLGLAARFVSGYLYDPPADEGNGPGFNRAVGSMHAWAEVFLPGAGWKGFDPTNGILANAYFIPTAVAIEPSSVDPIQGKFFSKSAAEARLEVDLEISAVK